MRLIEKGTDFDLFCSVLNVLPTGQYHKLFNMYDKDGGGYVDMKEFLLGLFNYVNMEKEEKVHLIFQLFDEDRSGFLSEDEIQEILKATHMQTAEGVKHKLATLMKQVPMRGCPAAYA
jgi:calcium-dependent protein kinase